MVEITDVHDDDLVGRVVNCEPERAAPGKIQNRLRSATAFETGRLGGAVATSGLPSSVRRLPEMLPSR